MNLTLKELSIILDIGAETIRQNLCRADFADVRIAKGVCYNIYKKDIDLLKKLVEKRRKANKGIRKAVINDELEKLLLQKQTIDFKIKQLKKMLTKI